MVKSWLSRSSYGDIINDAKTLRVWQTLGWVFVISIPTLWIFVGPGTFRVTFGIHSFTPQIILSIANIFVYVPIFYILQTPLFIFGLFWLDSPSEMITNYPNQCPRCAVRVDWMICGEHVGFPLGYWRLQGIQVRFTTQMTASWRCKGPS